ncbi:MAG: hypothetical protein ACPG7F_00640 [Aggregatilineales bacterium]
MKPSMQLIALLRGFAKSREMWDEARHLKKLEDVLSTPRHITDAEFKQYIWAWRRVMHQMNLMLIEDAGKLMRYEERLKPGA